MHHSQNQTQSAFYRSKHKPYKNDIDQRIFFCNAYLLQVN